MIALKRIFMAGPRTCSCHSILMVTWLQFVCFATGAYLWWSYHPVVVWLPFVTSQPPSELHQWGIQQEVASSDDMMSHLMTTSDSLHNCSQNMSKSAWSHDISLYDRVTWWWICQIHLQPMKTTCIAESKNGLANQLKYNLFCTIFLASAAIFIFRRLFKK